MLDKVYETSSRAILAIKSCDVAPCGLGPVRVVQFQAYGPIFCTYLVRQTVTFKRASFPVGLRLLIRTEAKALGSLPIDSSFSAGRSYQL